MTHVPSSTRVAVKHLDRQARGTNVRDLSYGDALVSNGNLPIPGGWVKRDELMTFLEMDGDDIVARHKGKTVKFHKEYLDAGTIYKRGGAKTAAGPEANAAKGVYAVCSKRSKEIAQALTKAGMEPLFVSVRIVASAQNDGRFDGTTTDVSIDFGSDWSKEDRYGKHDEFMAVMQRLGYRPADIQESNAGSYNIETKTR